MRRAAALMIVAAGAVMATGRVEAASAPHPSEHTTLAGEPREPAMKWMAVELSMVPRSDDASPAWKVRLQADGAGSYIESGAQDAAPVPLTVSEATLERVKLGEHAAKSGKCETKTKNIAKTGEKTIRYEAAEKTEECTFNYSDDVGLMGAAATFQAIAETVQRGERLQHDLRYDRLGLDAEIDLLVAAQKSGSAIEIANIAPVLQALVSDDHVIDRVRRKAARLLQDAGAPVPAGYDPSER